MQVTEKSLKLKLHEKYLHSMFDSHHAVMLIIDPITGSIKDANKAATIFYGYSRGQLLKMKIQEINMLLPEEVEMEREQALQEKRNYFRFPHRMANGEVKWVEVYSSPFNAAGKPLLLSVIHDISERKDFETALNESQYDLRLAQSVAHIGSWRLKIQTNELIWSDEAYRIFNVPSGTTLNYEAFLSFVHPDDRDIVNNRWTAALKGEEYNIDHRIVVDGKIKWVNETAILEFDDKGKLISGFGTVQDITKHKESEQELKRNEETLRHYAESLDFLSVTATRMIEKMESTELYGYITERLYEIAGGAIVTFSEFDIASNQLIVKELKCTKEERDNIIKLMGREPEGLSFNFPDEIRDRMKFGALDILEGGVYELVFGQLPKDFCSKFEQKLGIKSVFAMACSVDRDILGTVALLSHEPVEFLKNSHIIESFVNHAALALKRKRAEDKLRASEEKFEAAFKANPNGLILSNMDDGRIYEYNDAFLKIIGRNKEDIVGKSSLEIDVFVNPDDRSKAVALLRENGSLQHFEIRIKHSSGAERIVLLSLDIIKLSDRMTMLTTMQDVTSLKEAELKISNQANFITAITEAVPDMISIIELPSRNLFYTNREPFNEQGFNSQQLQKMTVEERMELMHPDDREPLSRYFEELSKAENADEIIIEYRARNFENKWIWFRARGRVFERNGDGSVKSCINVVQNITEQKTAQEKLQDSEQRLKAIFDNAAIGIIVTDSRDRLIDFNDRFCEILGYSRKELIGKTVHELTAPEDRKITDVMNARLHRGELRIFDYEKQYLKKNNTPLWVHVTVSSIVDSQGKHMNSISTIEDISKRREAEEELRNSEERFRSLTSASSDAMYTMSPDWSKMIWLNGSGFLSNTNQVNEDWLTRYIHPDDQTDVMNIINEAIANKRIFEMEHRVRQVDGSWGWTFSRAVPILDDNGNIIEWFGAASNITDRREMEFKLRESELQLQKKNEHLTKVNQLLEDFVHIAAHDLRGPIASLTMMSEYIELQIKTEDKELAFKEIMPIVNKLRHTVDGLMMTVNVQKDSVPNFKKIVFSEVYNETMDDCTNEFCGDKVNVVADFTKQPEIIYVEAYLKSILKNLLTNAIKYSSEVEIPRVQIFTKRVNEYILLEIRDNGIGMDLGKEGENLFKPFRRLTTKSKGTGMGLYIIKNIIEKNGGYIDVESKPNEGTTFYCFLREYHTV